MGGLYNSVLVNSAIGILGHNVPVGYLAGAILAPTLLMALLRLLFAPFCPRGRHGRGGWRTAATPSGGRPRAFTRYRGVTAALTTAALLLVILTSPVVGGPGTGPRSGAGAGSGHGGSSPAGATLDPATEAAVEGAIPRMTLEEKAGQLVMTGFSGTALTEDAASLIRDAHVGGLILFASNVVDSEQVRELTASLQAEAAKSGGPGLILGVDQEGGVVARLTEKAGVTVFPGNMALGAASEAAAAGANGAAAAAYSSAGASLAAASSDPAVDLARQAALVTGSELRDLGLNLDFAPVLDVNNNPANPVIGVRSFGEDPALASRLGAATIDGFHEAGLAAVGKHFPGHGDTATDSHYALPVVPWGMDRLPEVELPPFESAIEAGVDAIMVAHVAFPAVETAAEAGQGVPASLSPAVIGGLLRGDLGYDGVVMTDAIDMKAVSDRYDGAEAAQAALAAGADVVLVGQDPARAREACNGIVAAVREGRLDQARLDQSVRRVLRLKAKLGLLGPGSGGASGERATIAGGERATVGGGEPGTLAGGGRGTGSGRADWAEAVGGVGWAANREIALEVARSSVTLVQDRDQVLPLKAEPGEKVALITPSLGAPLADYLKARCGDVSEFVYPSQPSADAAAQAAALAASADVVILATAAPRMNAAVSRLVEAVVAAGDTAGGASGSDGSSPALGPKVIWASLWSPYDLSSVPSAGTYVTTYSYRDVSLQALVEAIFGEIPFRGKLPVALGG